jgi:hypothetical protein
LNLIGVLKPEESVPEFWVSSCLCAYRVRISYPLQWGAPTFDAGDVFGVMTAALVALVEVIILMMWVAFFLFFTSVSVLLQ